MGRFARLAYGGRKAALVGAGTALHLLAARGCAKVCGGTAHIVDVAFEIGVIDDILRFFKQRGMTARLHNAPLMERERAKSALAEAAPAASQGELHFRKTGNAAVRIVARMPRARIRQRIHRIHLFSRKRLGGRILHNVHVR